MIYKRVIRGGSWISDARDCRSAYRYGSQPGYRYNDLGFRVIKKLSASNRVLRGGSWYNDACVVRSAYRNAYDPGGRSLFVGFRVTKHQKTKEAEV